VTRLPAVKPPPFGENRSGDASGLFGARLFLIISSGYLMSYGLRAINATIAPELVDEMALSNTQLGSLTSAYFLAFACMQLPLGVCLDRFGPRRVDALLMAVAAAGCVTFAVAASFEELWIARALLGAGFSAGLMAPFALFRIWFAPRQQTRLAAWTMMVGTAGVLIATLPVRALLAVMDWRWVFLICAGLLLTISLLMWFGLPRSREPSGDAGDAGDSGAGRQPLLQALGGYREVIRSSFFWRMVLMTGAVQGGFIAMQTLWLGPWFTRVLGMTPQASAGALFVFNAALLGTYLLAGYLAPLVGQQERTTIRLTAIAALLVAVVVGFIAAVPAVAGVWAWLLLAAVTTVFTPIQARVGMSFPSRLAGRALTAYNLVLFIAAFAVQSVLGVTMDWVMAAGFTEQEAFRIALAGIAAVQFAVWVLFIFWPMQRLPLVAPAAAS
jgi:predicted MFS family arabinose efflux permease